MSSGRGRIELDVPWLAHSAGSSSSGWQVVSGLVILLNITLEWSRNSLTIWRRLVDIVLLNNSPSNILLDIAFGREISLEKAFMEEDLMIGFWLRWIKQWICCERPITICATVETWLSQGSWIWPVWHSLGDRDQCVHSYHLQIHFFWFIQDSGEHNFFKEFPIMYLWKKSLGGFHKDDL